MSKKKEATIISDAGTTLPYRKGRRL